MNGNGVVDRGGRIAEFSWSAWLTGGPEPERTRLRAMVVCPMRVASDGESCFISELHYRSHSSQFVRRTYLMSSGQKRTRVSGRKRVATIDTVLLVDHTSRLDYVTEPANWGYRQTRFVAPRAGDKTSKVAPYTWSDVAGIAEWFPLFHAAVWAGYHDFQEFSPVIDWLMETQPLVADLYTTPGVLKQ